MFGYRSWAAAKNSWQIQQDALLAPISRRAAGEDLCVEMILVIRVASGWVHSIIWDWLGRAGGEGWKVKVKGGVRPR